MFYSKDESTNYNSHVANTDNFKFFKYKSNIIGNAVTQSASNTANRILKKVVILNFWRSLANTCYPEGSVAN